VQSERPLLPLSHSPAYVSIRQHTSAYVSIRQHTSAYVSEKGHYCLCHTRLHISAYVSIRQHPSASVSIRQCKRPPLPLSHSPGNTESSLPTHRANAASSGQFRPPPPRGDTPNPPPHLHTSAYVSIRQHTSAYVGDTPNPPPHLHTSAYISIRQHTPAYVSIRQHT
jgi:hypothetical protein